MKKEFFISCIDDIYTIRYTYGYFDLIRVDSKNLKTLGVLRYALKYALWALKIDGVLVVQDEPLREYGFSNKRIDFWQIRHELFKSLKDEIEVLKLNDSEGYIEVIKLKENYINNGFSFGIVFSGNHIEIEQLSQTIRSILDNKNIDDYPYEILICGPSEFESVSYLRQFDSLKIRYLPYDLDLKHKRFMITNKKNFLFQNSQYNIVSISHTRIMYERSFILYSFNRKFDIFTPKVNILRNGKKYKYLDFGLIGSYSLDRQNSAKTLTSIVLDDAVLYYMRKRVPYIDGGITVFNKNIIHEPPYNEFIAWGEAEDVEMCNRAYNNGYLLDYFNDIQQESVTCKTVIQDSFIFEIKKIIRNFLVKKGFF